ncbi:helix-turn-helix domain-containing protein [Paenibacillus silvae]|uniref:AraC family transcriptional regulator n=1 Tax=Paenibacillus TaxID=44249 RepID=UPI001C10AE99|nr:AraC family transcriptional regulator [Paenibacillus barcinonensis]MBU5351461.1 AraC family transcriptional regulator [Paenibacillus barcinonensis]
MSQPNMGNPPESDMPLVITGQNRLTVNELIDWSHHSRDYTIVQCIGGTGRIAAKNREFSIRKGTTLIMFPEVTYHYNNPSSKLRFDCLSFNGYIVPRFLHSLQIGELRAFKLDGMLGILLREITIALKSRHRDQIWHGSALLYMLLVRLTIDGERYSEVERNEARLRLEELVAFIKQNYQQDLSLSILADQMKVTEQHLNRIFKKEFHMTPLEYLVRYRLLKAKEMLVQQKDITAHDIARAVGFNSASYFGSVFKKYEGISPIELRKQFQG